MLQPQLTLKDALLLAGQTETAVGHAQMLDVASVHEIKSAQRGVPQRNQKYHGKSVSKTLTPKKIVVAFVVGLALTWLMLQIALLPKLNVRFVEKWDILQGFAAQKKKKCKYLMPLCGEQDEIEGRGRTVRGRWRD